MERAPRRSEPGPGGQGMPAQPSVPGQLALPMPMVPWIVTFERPAAVVQGVGSLVVNATAPWTPLPTGKLGLLVVMVCVGGLPTGPLTRVTVTLATTVPCRFTAGPTELVV